MVACCMRTGACVAWLKEQEAERSSKMSLPVYRLWRELDHDTKAMWAARAISGKLEKREPEDLPHRSFRRSEHVPVGRQSPTLCSRAKVGAHQNQACGGKPHNMSVVV